MMDEPVSHPTHSAPPKRLRHLVVEWGIILLAALVVSIGLRTFALQTYFIPSGSMEPTLMVGDRIIVDKLAVDWGTINRGDILVFKSPPSENCGGTPVADLVKRVIGLPGDKLALNRKHDLRQWAAVQGELAPYRATRQRHRTAYQPHRRGRQPLLHDGRQPLRFLRQPDVGNHHAF